MTDDFPPVTGTFPKDSDGGPDIRNLSPHEGFNAAWKDALDQAAERWHNQGDPPIEVPVLVEFYARIDIYNPGGIGQYHVKLTPGG